MNPENTDAQLDALIRAARETAPDTTALEFAFETRLIARLREQHGTNIFAWAWKLAPFFAALIVAFGIWNRASAAHLESTASLMAEAVRQHPERLLLSLIARDR